MSDSTSYIGITVCQWCNSRYRVKAQHASLDGKSTRCPRCHHDFEIKIIRPSRVEEAAMESSTSDQATRKRRTRAEIRAEHHDRIRTSFVTYHKRLLAIRDAENSSEEEVRRWCVDVCREAFGYSDEEIDTEMRSLNKRIDIAIKYGDQVRMVIECKNIRSKLPDSARDQAVGYAVNQGAEWAVVTNGQVWRLHRVRFRKGQEPEVFQVFDVALLDEDGVSDDDVHTLYLLSKRALDSEEILKAYHHAACCSERSLLSALASERVIKSIRKEVCESYKDATGENVPLEDEEVYELVRDLFLPQEL
jgi:predicted Zn finger-like uncharacterized protein